MSESEAIRGSVRERTDEPLPEYLSLCSAAMAIYVKFSAELGGGTKSGSLAMRFQFLHTSLFYVRRVHGGSLLPCRHPVADSLYISSAALDRDDIPKNNREKLERNVLHLWSASIPQFWEFSKTSGKEKGTSKMKVTDVYFGL